MHNLNISLPHVNKINTDFVKYDWYEYYEKGVEQKATWINIYYKVIDKLAQSSIRANDANSILSEHIIISHRDLDPKNVMWKEGKPYLIDWEAAGYINPYQELLEVLNYWSDNGKGELDKDKFIVLFHTYRRYMNTKTVDWDYVLDSGYASMLGWLEYSLKRALGIECINVEERILGAEQILGTIAALEKYDKQKSIIKIWLSE